MLNYITKYDRYIYDVIEFPILCNITMISLITHIDDIYGQYSYIILPRCP